MPQKRSENRQKGVQIWGQSQPIETRLRELTEEVKAFRRELHEAQKKSRLGKGDERLPSRPDAPGTPARLRARKQR
jgi:hypothetical protein